MRQALYLMEKLGGKLMENGGVDRGNPQGKDFRGVEGYLKGIWGNPSLVKIQGKTKKNNKQT